VEKANGLILAGIKPRLVEPLKQSAGCWVKELPSVLWSLRTTPNRSVGFTPFFLVYGAEAMLPTDIEFVLLVDGARKLADGDQLMWKQTILVRDE
jgi:hypothetical protein